MDGTDPLHCKGGNNESLQKKTIYYVHSDGKFCMVGSRRVAKPASIKEIDMKKVRFLILALVLMLSSVPMVYANSDNPFELNNATEEELINRCFFSQEDAARILELRDSLGGFQSWDDLKELNLSEAQLSILASEATISGISTDCNC